MEKRTLRVIVAVVALGATLACASGSSPDMAMAPAMEPATAEAPEQEAARERFDDDAGGRGEAGLGGRAAKAKSANSRPASPVAKQAGAKDEPSPDDGDGKAAEPERTRAWFPEAFLWQPLVATGPDGTATVPFTVPDSLTTWRILGLAHDRSGQQTGSVTTFTSTLPVYVDAVVPGFLFAGDELVLPVQVMNNTDRAVNGALTVEAVGPVNGLGTASVALAAGGSDVRGLPLVAVGAGEARITARLRAGDDSDAAERVIPVRPAGRPVMSVAGGTLTDTRDVRVTMAAGADPNTQELEVVVFGGPLSVVSSEIERLSAGARPTNAAYGFALTARAEALAAAAGTELDAAVLRRVRLLTWQRLVRQSRAMDAGVAADTLSAMPAESSVEGASVLRSAAIRMVLDGQRADGTWSRTPNAPLQTVLVNTASIGRALPEDQTLGRMRAGAALERFLHEVKDPYTAAVVLASGLVDDGSRERLESVITDAVVRADDGTPQIDVPAGVQNPWGTRPPSAEVDAWVVLALPDGELRRDFAAALMARWSGSWGFGAGPADVLALEAMVLALPAAPAASTVSVLADGEVVASGTFDPAKPGEPLLLTSRPPRGARISLRAEPPLSGAAFVATHRSYVPWSDGDRSPGVDVSVRADGLAAGQQGEVVVQVLAPSNRRVSLELPLPAGAAPDAASLAAANPGSDVVVAVDRVLWTSAPFQPGWTQTLRVPVTPAFGGRFTTDPMQVKVDGGGEVALRPATFRVKPAGS